ncbi:protease modulator HflC [Leeia sp. TBRC 13508]|uniref:Protein HflC n=1 Tax=Leeia speluncae TaxID=2884804 RepID=A0ABS8DAP8_9NEIS|nr:protease modulator HflC [Leeia speluncae]MCB6185281.1 protease modulator HflC [Leeia speluncae]
MQKLISTAVVLLLALFLVNVSLFTVNQAQYAMVFQFGEIVRVVKEPGIQFKVPLTQSVKLFEKRVQTIDAEAPDPFNTKEKKNVLVDSFIKWRVSDVVQFYKSTGGDNQVAEMRIRQIVNSGLRDEIGNVTVYEVITGKRDSIMSEVRKKVNMESPKLGVEVLDVRLKRVDFPQNISTAVYERMNAERKRVANELRSEGAAEAERIKADADRQREVIIAEAYKKAQEVKGEGDAKAAKIYASAFSKNPEFYSFYKSMEAYQNSFKNKSDVIVLDPSSDFFKYLKNPSGALKPAK